MMLVLYKCNCHINGYQLDTTILIICQYLPILFPGLFLKLNGF